MDADVWIQLEIKGDGGKYYEYILLYVDDRFCVSEDPESDLI